MATRSRLLRVLDFGTQLVPFKQALQLQELLHSARHAGSVPDTLVLLQVCFCKGPTAHASANRF